MLGLASLAAGRGSWGGVLRFRAPPALAELLTPLSPFKFILRAVALSTRRYTSVVCQPRAQGPVGDIQSRCPALVNSWLLRSGWLSLVSMRLWAPPGHGASSQWQLEQEYERQRFIQQTNIYGAPTLCQALF